MIDPPVDKNGKKVTSIVRDYDDMCRDTTVDFIITIVKGKIEELESQIQENGCNGIEKLFKLYSTCGTSNMHLFDAQDKLKKYANVCEIIDDYFETRLKLYQVRKEYLIDALTKQLVVLSNKSRYIKDVLEGEIDLRKKTKEQVSKMLSSKGFTILDEDIDYKYLVKLPMDSVAEENVLQLEKEHKCKANELELVKTKSIQKMWEDELTSLEVEYGKYQEDRIRSQNGNRVEPKKTKLVVKK